MPTSSNYSGRKIGRPLLALDATETKNFLLPDPDASLRLQTSIEKQTLGKSLGKMRESLKLLDDVETVPSDALVTRNQLAHRFNAQYALAVMNQDGRSEMPNHSDVMAATLSDAYAIARNVVQAMVTGVHLMKAAHVQPKA